MSAQGCVPGVPEDRNLLGEWVTTALAPAGRLELPPMGRGALDGVRVAVKDLFDVAGTVTAAGNPALADGPPADQDADAVARIRRAGGVVVAKAATDELAMGMFGVNEHYGTPVNPVTPGRVPGGSSSGSACLVAGHEADLGLGSDTGGSIRVPAAFCGLIGLRPTHGFIDASGLRPMAPVFDTVGLLGRDLDTVARAFGVLSGSEALGAAAGRPARRVRDLLLIVDLLEHALEPVADLAAEAAAVLASRCGLGLRTVRWGDRHPPDRLVRCFWTLMSRSLWQSQAAWVEREHPVLGTGIAERITAGGDLSEEAVTAASSQRRAFRQWAATALADAVVVLPTTWALAPPRESSHADLMAWRDRNLAHTVVAPLLGGPQLALPTDWVDDGAGPAPASWSLLGLPGDDELLFSLAATLHPTDRIHG